MHIIQHCKAKQTSNEPPILRIYEFTRLCESSRWHKSAQPNNPTAAAAVAAAPKTHPLGISFCFEVLLNCGKVSVPPPNGRVPPRTSIWLHYPGLHRFLPNTLILTRLWSWKVNSQQFMNIYWDKFRLLAAETIAARDCGAEKQSLLCVFFLLLVGNEFSFLLENGINWSRSLESERKKEMEEK